MLWVLKRTSEHPKHILKMIGKKIYVYLQLYSENCCLSKPVVLFNGVIGTGSLSS